MKRDERLILISVYMQYDCNTYSLTSTVTSRSFSAGCYTSSYSLTFYYYGVILPQEQNFFLLNFVRFLSAQSSTSLWIKALQFSPPPKTLYLLSPANLLTIMLIK